MEDWAWLRQSEDRKPSLRAGGTEDKVRYPVDHDATGRDMRRKQCLEDERGFAEADAMDGEVDVVGRAKDEVSIIVIKGWPKVDRLFVKWSRVRHSHTAFKHSKEMVALADCDMVPLFGIGTAGKEKLKHDYGQGRRQGGQQRPLHVRSVWFGE